MDAADILEGDGNAFAIMGRVTQALRDAGKQDLIRLYTEAAMDGDYDNLLRVSAEYAEVAIQ